MRRLIFLLAAVACLGVGPRTSAAATARDAASGPGAHSVHDPFERFNRAVFRDSRSFNGITHAIAAGYRSLTPGPIGKAIHNILMNLREPIVILNDVLQLRIRMAGEASARTAFNSTLGLAGAVDVAGAAGNPQQQNGFADTLGRWGVRPGAYLFLPLLGPTTTRDLFGSVVDAASSPLRWWRYPYNTDVNIAVAGAEGLDTLSGTQAELDALLGEAADPYATLRSVYLQNRQGEIDAIRGAAAASEVPAALPDLGPPPSEAAPPAEPPSTPPDAAAPGPRAALERAAARS